MNCRFFSAGLPNRAIFSGYGGGVNSLLNTGGYSEKRHLFFLIPKTAFFASDPNWGRILAAVGRAGIAGLDLARGPHTTVWICDFSYDYVRINAEYCT